MRLTKLRSGVVPLFALLALGVGMAGCSGDDGSDGTNGTNGTNGATGPTGPAGGVGPTGPTGPAGPGAKIEPRESCAVCHDNTSAFDVAVVHAVSPDIEVSNVTIAPSATVPADLVMSITVKSGGTPFTGLTQVNAARRFDGTISDNLTSTTPDFPGDVARTVTLAPVTGSGNAGKYTITLVGGATLFGATPNRYFFRLETVAGAVTRIRAIGLGDYPSSPDDSLVSAAGCSGCHGTNGGGGFHYSYPASGATCTVCHDATNTNYPRLIDIGHGIHASHGMPDGEFVLETVDGEDSWTYSATYPTYMNNCSVCHTAASGALAKVNAMPVTGEGCLSCHGSMESWEFSEGLSFHEIYTEATDCQSCHNSGVDAAAPRLVDVRDFHDGLETERIGIIYGGEDLSVTKGAEFNWTITQVVDDKVTGKLSISWTAEFPKGTSINPCNTTATDTAPVFFPFGPNTNGEGTLSMLRSYAQGDDYVLGQASAPGQAAAVNLSATVGANGYTSCVGNVATTVINRDNMPDGTRAIVALQGKPQLPVPAGMTDEHWAFPVMFVRVPTPTYEFAVGTGAPVTPRRVVADTQECLGCHVGSLYQHGNTRVDNVTMCIICHNSASSEQNNRVAMGVDKTEAYDGKVGQTYEFKTMLHAIHSVGMENDPIVIYRTRGIYAWTPEGTTLPNWGTTPACEKATPTEGQEYLVYGADPTLDVSCQPFSLYHPTYPRDERQCAACHVAGFDTIPDQAKAVATTINAGTAPWPNQLDDTLQGASAAACTSCHSTTEARGHAYQSGWTPQTFENGRQTILDTE